MAGEFFRTVVAEARELKLTCDEHFTVDGTLVEAWASLKSFKRKDAGPSEPPDDPGNPTVNFHGERRTNETHQSTTDPEARLAKKGAGKEAKLCYSAHALMENRNTILIDFQVEPADGRAERRAALAMVGEGLPGRQRITLGGDKGYDTHDFVASCRALKVTPHVAQNLARAGGSAIDARTVRHPGLRRQSMDPQAGRRDLRLDEDHRRACVAPAIVVASGCRCMPTWSPPPTTCSESPSSVPLPHETRPLNCTSPKVGAESRRPALLNPGLLTHQLHETE